MALCKRCSKVLTGKQVSYCSFKCSKLHLKSLYRARNRDKIKKYNRQWRLLNPEKYRMQQIRYYQKLGKEPRKLKFPNVVEVYEVKCGFCEDGIYISKRRRKHCPFHGHLRNTKLRFRILERDAFTCHYCGRKPPEVVLEVDHIVPTSKGGTNESSNLKTSCRECNIGKRDQILYE